MSGIFGSTPTPPNPIQTAAASTSTNVATGVANAMLNNVNQNTPEGSLRYDTTSNYSWADPVTGVTYSIPQFTATQSLSPFGQELQGYQQGAQLNLGQAAGTGSQRIEDLLASGSNPLNSAPGSSPLSWLYEAPQALRSFGPTGSQQFSLGDTGQQQATFGDDAQGNGPKRRSMVASTRSSNVSAAISNRGLPTRVFATVAKPTHARWTTTPVRPTMRGLR
jgi:hypothetical protein